MSMRRAISTVLIVSTALPVANHARAQDAALEEVVVTARKRDENVFEIPVSVSAKSQEQLKRAGINNPEQLSSFVPGLDFQASQSAFGRQNPSISFRGMVQQNITPSTQVVVSVPSGGREMSCSHQEGMRLILQCLKSGAASRSISVVHIHFLWARGTSSLNRLAATCAMRRNT